MCVCAEQLTLRKMILVFDPLLDITNIYIQSKAEGLQTTWQASWLVAVGSERMFKDTNFIRCFALFKASFEVIDGVICVATQRAVPL